LIKINTTNKEDIITMFCYGEKELPITMQMYDSRDQIFITCSTLSLEVYCFIDSCNESSHTRIYTPNNGIIQLLLKCTKQIDMESNILPVTSTNIGSPMSTVAIYHHHNNDRPNATNWIYCNFYVSSDFLSIRTQMVNK
jgi:hypothetical protein